jgi:phenylpropionate dioxygenase-like ring-hydroxylating dioxygenase large terminal subunit
MTNMKIEAIRDSVDKEISRSSYPPEMPDVLQVPALRYADPAFYELEMTHLWRKTWLHAGHVSELPQVGDYKLFEQLGTSIIISRGEDNVIRAFHNICRHRGSVLLHNKNGRARRITCPYHAWNYAADGSLLSVPDSQDFAPLNKDELGLLPVRCETLQGLIFINMDENAEPLEDSCGAFERQIEELPFNNAVVKEVYTVDLDCNWKVAYDNFLEIYHVRTVHAKSVAKFLNSKSFVVSLYKNGHSRFITRKNLSASFFGKESVDSKRPETLLDEYTLALPIFPNTFMPVDPTNFTIQGFWPVSPNKTVMVMYMMGWDKEEKEDAQLWEGVRSQIKDIIREDAEIFSGVQRSMESGLLPHIMMNYQERAVYWYHEELDRRIGINNIPAQMRVEPVLAPFVED